MTQSFSKFITEEPKEQKYKVFNLVHDTPDDPNKTGDEMVAEAEKLGISTYQLKVNGGYFSVNEKGNLMAHNFFSPRVTSCHPLDFVSRHPQLSENAIKHCIYSKTTFGLNSYFATGLSAMA